MLFTSDFIINILSPYTSIYDIMKGINCFTQALSRHDIQLNDFTLHIFVTPTVQPTDATPGDPFLSTYKHLHTGAHIK